MLYNDILCYNMRKGVFMDFKDKLKLVRGVLVISQSTLAKMLDVSFCTINRLENGKTTPSFLTQKKLEKLCIEKDIAIEG